ncbi:MAG: hypothetical protein ACTTJH_02660 [Bacteroidales bacterium]
MIKFTKELAEKIDNIFKGFSEEELAQRLIESYNEIKQVDRDVLTTSYAQAQINVTINMSDNFDVSGIFIGLEKAA